MEKKFYDTPQVSVVKVELEKMCATSGDPTITTPNMGWGAREEELFSDKLNLKNILE
ncbi:MAG: hypothetical protein IKW22_02380 [Bacteroidaceae bacterium]|nr:hypothetical protein [Bacteroidaceae bacterium]